jgi:hypothetical protein
MDGAVDQGGKSLQSYSVTSTWPIPGLRPVEFYVSETLFHSDRYALFARTEDGMEIWLAGTFHSKEEALKIAGMLIAVSSDTSGPVVSFVPRSKSWDDKWYGRFEKDSLLDVLKDHFKGAEFELPSTMKAIKERLLRPKSLFGIVIFCAILSFLFGISIPVPKEVTIPLLGEALSGKTLGPPQVASYLPATLLILYALMQSAVAGRSRKLNNVRRAILELVRRGGYGRNDLVASLQKDFVQKQSADVMPFLERQFEGWYGRAIGLRPRRDREPLREEATTPADDLKRIETWTRFLESDFDRRVHNLAMLDRQPGFRSFMMCFDPVMYLVTTNRLRWVQYVDARERGVNALDLPLVENPDAIDIRGVAGGFLVSLAYFVILGLPLAWSIWRLEGASTATYVQNIAMSAAVVTAVTLWIYLAVMRRWGFPVAEPMGAYTSDYVPRQVMTM